MAVLWPLTCAAVILSLLQENNFLIVYRTGEMSDRSIKHLSRSLET